MKSWRKKERLIGPQGSRKWSVAGHWESFKTMYRIGFGVRVWLRLGDNMLIKGVRISDGIRDKIWMRLPISKINRGGIL